MKNFDITLYGNLVYDNIYNGFDYKTSVGGIGNVWAHLKTIDPDLKVKLEPTDIGESLIMANREQCKRTSISRLSLKTKEPTIHDSKISHVMYINEISDCSFLKKLQGYVTADVCNGKSLIPILGYLKYIDLLMISDEDLGKANVYELAALTRHGVLLHYSTGSDLIAPDGTMIKNKAELIPNINVLGAGDKLAAQVIAGIVDTPGHLHKVIQNAHNALTLYYKNEKI